MSLPLWKSSERMFQRNKQVVGMGNISEPKRA
jgi:hypothetical protein